MKRGTRGMGHVFQRGNTWWIQLYHQGRRLRESSGSTRRPVAVKLLQQRQQEARGGRPHDESVKIILGAPPQAADAAGSTDTEAPVSLWGTIEADYKLHQRRSGKRLRQLWAHVAGYFGRNEPAVAITTARVKAYLTARLDEGAARGTIKNELNALRHAFKLAVTEETLLANEIPIFPTIPTPRARKGFFEREEHELVRAALPPDEGDLAEYLYWTGWRTSEAKGLEWRNVDERAGIIRIEDSKNNEPRELPYSALPDLAALIAHRREVTDAVQRTRGMVVKHVFHRNGDRIRHFRRSWKTACIAAGLGQEIRESDVLDAVGQAVKRGRLVRKVALRIPHDYRRSAARNLSRAGVPEQVIMALCGWKTRTVFDRYRIVAPRDLTEGLAKLAAAAPGRAPSKVTRMRRRAR